MLLRAKKLDSQINEFRFLLRGSDFIKKREIKFATSKEAKDFLIKFLIVECISGIHYSKQDLKSCYKKIKKLVKRNKVISSEDLPIHQMKKHADKELQNVHYILQKNICKYKKDCS